MIKKLLAIGLSAALVLALLAGCGGGNDPSAENPTGTPAASTPAESPAGTDKPPAESKAPTTPSSNPNGGNQGGGNQGGGNQGGSGQGSQGSGQGGQGGQGGGNRPSGLSDPLNLLTGPVSVPDKFTDGTYRRVAGEAQLTREGSVVYSSGTISVWPIGGAAAEVVTINTIGADEPLHYLLESIGANSSFTVTGGKVTAIVIRPPTFGTTERNCVYLTGDFMQGVRVTVACNPTQSPDGGAVTPTDTSIIISDTLTTINLDLRGDGIEEQANDGLVTLNDGALTFNASAPAGSSAKFGTTDDNGARSFTITKNNDGTITFLYTVG